MSTVPTVKVKRDGPKGYHIINESDFDPKKHERFDDAAREDGEAKPATSAELKAALDAKGITYKSNASKADLQALLDGAAKD